jgi:hypothetical protein
VPLAGFRTLGGGAAGDAKLVPKPHESHSDHGLPGPEGFCRRLERCR